MPNETDNEEGARGNVSRRNFFERIGVAGAVAAMPTGPVPAAAQTMTGAAQAAPSAHRLRQAPSSPRTPL